MAWLNFFRVKLVMEKQTRPCSLIQRSQKITRTVTQGTKRHHRQRHERVSSGRRRKEEEEWEVVRYQQKLKTACKARIFSYLTEWVKSECLRFYFLFIKFILFIYSSKSWQLPAETTGAMRLWPLSVSREWFCICGSGKNNGISRSISNRRGRITISAITK